jgi:hypothetical protein
MVEKISSLIDFISEFIAARKGLLPLIGILLVLLNLLVQFFPAGWLTTSNLLMHLGIMIAILGLLLARAL